MPGQPAAQRAFDVVDLTDPVELVAGQVEQHDDLGVDRVGDVRDVHLVDLEGGQIARCGRAASAATSPASMLAPSALVATGTERAQRRRGHPGGGRLAVGAGDDDGAAAAAELCHQAGIDSEGDEPADHRAVTAAGLA